MLRTKSGHKGLSKSLADITYDEDDDTEVQELENELAQAAEFDITSTSSSTPNPYARNTSQNPACSDPFGTAFQSEQKKKETKRTSSSRGGVVQEIALPQKSMAKAPAALDVPGRSRSVKKAAGWKPPAPLMQLDETAPASAMTLEQQDSFRNIFNKKESPFDNNILGGDDPFDGSSSKKMEMSDSSLSFDETILWTKDGAYNCSKSDMNMSSNQLPKTTISFSSPTKKISGGNNLKKSRSTENLPSAFNLLTNESEKRPGTKKSASSNKKKENKEDDGFIVTKSPSSGRKPSFKKTPSGSTASSTESGVDEAMKSIEQELLEVLPSAADLLTNESEKRPGTKKPTSSTKKKENEEADGFIVTKTASPDRSPRMMQKSIKHTDEDDGFIITKSPSSGRKPSFKKTESGDGFIAPKSPSSGRNPSIKKTPSGSTASSTESGDDEAMKSIEEELLQVLATGVSTGPKKPSRNKSNRSNGDSSSEKQHLPLPTSPIKRRVSEGDRKSTSRRQGSGLHRRRDSNDLRSTCSNEECGRRKSPSKLRGGHRRSKLDFIGASEQGKSLYADETETTATPTSRMTETTEASHRSSRSRRNGSVSSRRSNGGGSHKNELDGHLECTTFTTFPSAGADVDESVCSSLFSAPIMSPVNRKSSRSGSGKSRTSGRTSLNSRLESNRSSRMQDNDGAGTVQSAPTVDLSFPAFT